MNITSDYKLEPCLATECSKVSDTSYIVKVDVNKRWQDGSNLIAKDVQFTIDRLKEGRNVYSYNVEKVIGLEVIDSSTIKINLSEPVPFFEYNLTFPILSNNYYLGEDFYNSSKTPMGTGMYKIVSMENGNIILGKNDRWWNIEKCDSKIEAISIKIFNEMGEVYNSFKLGNIDVLSTSNENIENYIGTIGYIKNDYKSRNFVYLAFNCESNVLCNPEVRKAIATIYNDNYYTSNFPLDYGNYLYNDEFYNIEYNQDLAKKVLVEKEWEYKYNRWQRTEGYSTNKINITLTVNKDNEARVVVAENIKTQLEQIGMKITIKKVSTSQYNDIIETKNYEMILTGVYNSYSPNVERFFGTNNLQNYENEEINNILNEVKNTSDENVLKEKYKRIVEIYNEDVPFLGLYRNKATVVKSQNVAGELTPNNYFSYYNIHTWSRF